MPYSRKLGAFESMLARSNELGAVNIISVLRFAAPPDTAVIRQALDLLQQQHTFLRVRITALEDGYAFEEDPAPPPIPLTESRHDDPEAWHSHAEDALNHPIGGSAPLMQARLIHRPGGADLLFVFHHAILDGRSGSHFLNAFLNRCAALQFGAAPPPAAPFPPLPPVESRLPGAGSRTWLLRRLPGFMARQAADELRFQFRTRGLPTPGINLAAKNRILTLRTPREHTRHWIFYVRENRLTLNSLLNAAVVLASYRTLYPGRPRPMRTMTFADLRAYLDPPPPDAALGSYISMLRYTLPLTPQTTLHELAGLLHPLVFSSFKRDEKYINVLMSFNLIRMVSTLNRIRLGNTALSYTGPALLGPAAATFGLEGLHGFIANNTYGPEITAQVRIFKHELWWDFIYLDTDMDESQARAVLTGLAGILTPKNI